MFESVADTIRKLRSLFWSDRDPTGQGFVALAEAYRESGDLDEAEKLLLEGLERHPDLSSGHVVLARVHKAIRLTLVSLSLRASIAMVARLARCSLAVSDSSKATLRSVLPFDSNVR